jgi:hypothetical protein
MRLLEQAEDSVRLECELCHAHRVVPLATYNHARRWRCGIPCVACARMTCAEPIQHKRGGALLAAAREWRSRVVHGWSHHHPRPL